MNLLDAIVLGILEGLTEFLPVSSTGHLILVSGWLGQGGSEAAKTLDIVIQLGAVLAVIVYFRRTLLDLARGLLRRDAASIRLALSLAVGFVPAAIIGLALHKAIKAHLFGPLPVAGALVVGGVVMIAIERIRARRGELGLDGLEHVTPARAAFIGVAQSLALWPGASRSMTSIVGGQLVGLSTKTAAEFSFLLAIPTLGAATVFDLLKNGRALLEAPGGAGALVVGMAVAFAVALAVIAGFLKFLPRIGLAPFGAYRVVLGAIVVLAAARGITGTEPTRAQTPTTAGV